MTQKDLQKKLAKIYCDLDSLVMELDFDDVEVKDEFKTIVENGKEYQALLEPALELFFSNGTISRTTFFTTMQRKKDYIFDKEYNKFKG